MRTRSVFLLLALLLIVGGVFVGFRHQTATPGETVTAIRGPAIEAVYATGEVELAVWAELAAQLTGRVEAVPATEGQAVTAGQLLVQLDQSVERHQLTQLQANLTYLRQDLRRQQALGKESFASRQRIEDLASQVAATEAQIAAQAALLDRLQITAPFAGVVIRRDVEPGETIKQGDTVLWIGAPASLRVTAEVDEEDIARVTPGQTVLLKADAFPGQVLRTTVGEITPKGDPLNKNFRVRMPLSADSPLRPGMTVEANIIVREVKDALLVPATALRDNRVFQVTGRTVTPVAVRTGIAGITMVQVLDGLGEGDRILREAPAPENQP
jgi:RND family efflux transporter MFP subunit